MPKDKIIPAIKNSKKNKGHQLYKGLPLIRSKKITGYSQNILDAILALFEHADAIKSFTPKFLRFNFWKDCSEEDMKRFFKNIRESHRKENKKFLYLCTAEEDKKGIHFHAFCIVSSNDYIYRKDIIQELNKHADSIINGKYEANTKLQIPRKPRAKLQLTPNDRSPKKYNFYSISKHCKANREELREAFWAASYLAKIDQIPKNSSSKRRLFKSVIKKLNDNEIRPGFKHI